MHIFYYYETVFEYYFLYLDLSQTFTLLVIIYQSYKIKNVGISVNWRFLNNFKHHFLCKNFHYSFVNEVLTKKH